MFLPEKTRKDLICEHCGNIIPTANYFERYDGYNYHLECLWDRVINDKLSNNYIDARQFFFSLKNRIGRWPNVGVDTEEDYKQDLLLVQHNDRINGDEEEI